LGGYKQGSATGIDESPKSEIESRKRNLKFLFGIRDYKEKFEILISNSRVEREILNFCLVFREEKEKSRAHIFENRNGNFQKKMYL